MKWVVAAAAASSAESSCRGRRVGFGAPGSKISYADVSERAGRAVEKSTRYVDLGACFGGGAPATDVELASEDRVLESLRVLFLCGFRLAALLPSETR